MFVCNSSASKYMKQKLSEYRPNQTISQSQLILTPSFHQLMELDKKIPQTHRLSEEHCQPSSLNCHRQKIIPNNGRIDILVEYIWYVYQNKLPPLPKNKSHIQKDWNRTVSTVFSGHNEIKLKINNKIMRKTL